MLIYALIRRKLLLEIDQASVPRAIYTLHVLRARCIIITGNHHRYSEIAQSNLATGRVATPDADLS